MIAGAPRRRFLRALPGLALLARTTGTRAATLEPWKGGATPPLAGRTLAGAPFVLADQRGRTVLVNFWATWCAPCVAEMPALQRLADRLAPRGVTVVAVNFQENAARIAPFVERLGITLPVVRDHDGAVRAAWNVNVFPTTFVVGPDQRIAWVARGEVDWDDPQVESRIVNPGPR
ncbi:MAG: TlpA family protein disulfide reductase [Betaproteobacteria bacterium]|jgi:thiol-disulfide isomerase/thioredoxin|nr:TlpA family protein disulfide reductase [Betaproteobacteria bacterium]MCC7217831.1 TlpA family protein disulfide reductase [Burkholderiales bacterium]